MINTATPTRCAVKLVYDRGENPLVWLVDESKDESIRCCRWAFDSSEEAEFAQQATAKALSLGATTDEVLKRAGFTRHAEIGSFTHSKNVEEFLASGIDPGLLANARKLLGEVGLTDPCRD